MLMVHISNKVKSVATALPVCLFALMLVAVSCKDEDSTVVEEFPNWQSKNDFYFASLYNDTKAKIDAGDTQWLLLPGFNKPDLHTSSVPYPYAYYDYVVVEKITEPGVDNSDEVNSPLDTDSAEVHYIGKLLPSTSYPDGAEFNRSYDGEFDPVVATPISFYVGGLIIGFRTALYRMHRKDHWRVYIPYQLGYGTTVAGDIPAFSDLIFDIRLVDFWRKERGDRD